MELRYSFDPERFFLGKPCEEGHRWPGTDQSLRRIEFRGKRGGLCGRCMGCGGRKLSHWLISFIDYEASGFPPDRRLGKLCQRGHRWEGAEMTLRDARGKCIECEVLRRQEYVLLNREKISTYQREWQARKMQDESYAAQYRKKNQERSARAERRQARVQYKRRCRAELRAQGLTTRGTAPVLPDPEIRALQSAIRHAGLLPSVPRLVMDAQRQYWKENTEAYKEHQRRRALDNHRWRYLTDPDYRLYHRQKSKRRKAKERGSIGVHVKGKRIRQRFAQFGHRCAYCGATGDLQIEHLIPIAKGGAHVLGNILPACRRCNYSKTTHEAEAWYRSQSFFCERRWQRIRRVLGLGKGAATQLSLL